MKDRLLNIGLVLAILIAVIGANKGLRHSLSGAIDRTKNAIIAFLDSSGGRNSEVRQVSTSAPSSFNQGTTTPTTVSNSARGDDLLAADDPAAVAGEALPELPAIVQLPQTAQGTAGRDAAADVAGPQHPHVVWNLALPADSRIGAITTDDIVYVFGDYVGDEGYIGAVRDGKFLWEYQVSEPTDPVSLDTDGRMWMSGKGSKGSYVLNAKGEGGYLTGRFSEAGSPSDANCSQSIKVHPGQATEFRPIYRAFGHDVELDYACRATAVGTDHTAYIATEAPDIRAVTRTGTIDWQIKTACVPTSLIAGPPGSVLYECKDNSLHYVENGTVRWSDASEGDFLQVVIDREGTTYFVVTAFSDPLTHQRHEHPATYIHAVSSKGTALWTLQTSDLIARSIRLDGKGRLYLAGVRNSSPTDGRLFCISDQ
jgi:hypothetical protein